jgi:hypothetical protein
MIHSQRKQKQPIQKRSLYQCFNARVKVDTIYCDHGISFNTKKGDGTLPLNRLVRGEPLELGVCQHCASYEEMGPPVFPEERGWIGE